MEKTTLRNLGYGSIAIAVLAWPAGLFILKWKAVPNILAVHLFFIFLGIYLKRKA